MNANTFVKRLASICIENVFNPYSDTCDVFDLAAAASIRRRNLRNYLGAVELLGVDTIWMGRDLGYRGGRRTGLALTDEYHLGEMQSLFPGAVVSRATKGSAVAERTATEIWDALRVLQTVPLLWNVFPLHPHEPENSLSNRRFKAGELALVENLNAALIAWLRIRRIVCIGQDAAHYAGRFCDHVTVVRHPSYGGVADFRRGIAEAYGLQRLSSAAPDKQQSLFGPTCP